MNRYTGKLRTFLAEQPPSFRFDDANSITEMLCYYYCSANPVDNAVIRCQFEDLFKILGPMTVDESDAVFAVVSDLCLSHEKQAFLNGLCVGMHLFLELEAAD